MSMPSIVCSACQAPVPYGRLSCPACGELLASVAGVGRRMGIAILPSPDPDLDLEPVDTADAPPEADADPGSPVAAAPIGRPEPIVAAAAAAPDEAWDDELEADELVADEPVAIAEPEPPVADTTDVPSEPDVDGPPVQIAPSAIAAVEPRPRPQPSVLTDVVAPVWPADLPDAAPIADPVPAAIAPPAAAAAVAPPVLPGAYVPPSPAIPAGPALPAREYAGTNGAAAAAAAATATGEPGTKEGPLDGLDPAKVAEFIDWVAVAGAALAAVGFVLPWSVTVIGSSGTDYLERWGLAGPGHPLIVLGLLAILVLAILHHPIPAWIRVGVAGLGVGAFLLGLLWPYVIGPLGAMPGAMASLVGTIVLLAAAGMALAVHRHAGPTPDV